MISVNSLRHTPYLFQHFVGNIFEGGFVFSYVLNYFGTQNGEFCMNSSLFFGTFFVGKYFRTRNCTFLSLQIIGDICTKSSSFFCKFCLGNIFGLLLCRNLRIPRLGDKVSIFVTRKRCVASVSLDINRAITIT